MEKALEKVPARIALKLQGWIVAVERDGLEVVRKVPGYHDEPLKGDRQGQRSIRLNRAYRAIYEVVSSEVQIVLIVDVNKHKY